MSNVECVVNYNQLSGHVQNIYRTGSQIMSIAKVA
ncbi:phycobilisome linker polypeptide [Nostoc favosum]|uniref:Phycobilisome linker polypeptide n=1 Tax=Nostoc favosum CHAB5714 TaxID=2780399 RepID=A0ABS8I4A8_9NOSO|nr:phycobilisome linker polypeptide [Nostoc favosum]MCC5599019.1 phycobilisome linker polypeptide [Nostoc favosum CHAB5714]